MLKKLGTVINRIYSDYLMKDRLDEYEKLIMELLKHEFKFVKINEYDTLNNNQKYIFIRHDVDSEMEVAKKMFKIEKKYNVCTTYYFRRSTLNVAFARELIEAGMEVGYHYEEVADYAKKNRIINSVDITNHMDEIRNIFTENTRKFEKRIQFKIDTVASHGDWINRHLKYSNKEIVTSEIKKELNLKCEAYDIEKNLDFRIADRSFPDFWFPQSPYDILQSNFYRKGLILIHTRQWCSSPIERCKQDFYRLSEGLHYKLRKYRGEHK